MKESWQLQEQLAGPDSSLSSASLGIWYAQKRKARGFQVPLSAGSKGNPGMCFSSQHPLAFKRWKRVGRLEAGNASCPLLQQRAACAEGNICCLSPLRKTDTVHGGKHAQRLTLLAYTAALFQTCPVPRARCSESLTNFLDLCFLDHGRIWPRSPTHATPLAVSHPSHQRWKGWREVEGHIHSTFRLSFMQHLFPSLWPHTSVSKLLLFSFFLFFLKGKLLILKRAIAPRDRAFWKKKKKRN